MLRLLEQQFWVLLSVSDQSCNTLTKTDEKHGDGHARERLQTAKSVVTLSLTSSLTSYKSTLSVKLTLLQLQQANMGTVFGFVVELRIDSTLKMRCTGNLFVHVSILGLILDNYSDLLEQLPFLRVKMRCLGQPSLLRPYD